MLLEDLRVLHLSKKAAPEGFVPPVIGGAFFLDSCQRWLWVLTESSLASVDSWSVSRLEGFSGTDAYRFLLQVACGLESQLAGETDIFGQMKEAWLAFSRTGSPQRGDLSPWIQHLFADTKEIRTQHLQHLGCASYGSLVRRLLREAGAELAGPVLVVGAGQAARSVAPWLAEFGELRIWNRTADRLRLLASELPEEMKRENLRLFAGPEQEASAWAGVSHAILCIPVDPERDARRVKLWQGLGSLIHLGALRQQGGVWSALPRFHPLDDLFALQKEQDQTRVRQLHRARQACRDRALLRAMGRGSISVSHGWEDLAAFA